MRRKWEPYVDDLLRLVYRHEPIDQIAEAIGRSRSSIYSHAKHIGLVPDRIPFRPKLDRAIRHGLQHGWSDAEIARDFGCSREYVCERRRALGLPPSGQNDRYRDRVRRTTSRQLKDTGCRSLGELRVKVYRERAKAAGWPEDLRFRAVQILNALWDRGPMTRREIAEAIGMPWKGSRKSLVSNDPEGSYLAHLMKRGLVVQLKRAKQVIGRGNGRSVSVYTLAFDVQRNIPTEEREAG